MKSEFTFTRDDSHRFLPWHIGTMVALATLLLALVISLGQWVGGHAQDYSGSLSVIIPGSVEKLDEKTQSVKTLLSKQSEIAQTHIVSEADLRELLAPWIGTGDALTDAALPVVIDLTLTKKADAEALRKSLLPKLADIAPTIEIDSKNSWAALFAQFIAILQILAISLVLVVVVAMVMMIAFSARASLHLHKRTVNLLHAMGAEDAYIARQFQNELFKIGLRGAVIGAAIAAVAYIALGFAIAKLKAAVLPSFDVTFAHIILVVLMPFICALIALISTRLSVLGQLKRVL